MNPRRGHESRLHLEAKAIIANIFNDPEWSVFYEQRDADIIVMNHTSGFVAAIELESSPRNVTRNIERNLANGCHAVATVSLTDRFHRQIANKVLTHLAGENRKPIQIFPYNDQGLRELRNWIGVLLQTHHSHRESNP